LLSLSEEPGCFVAEDASQVGTEAAECDGCLRSLAIGVWCQSGPVNLAATISSHARDPARPLVILGITPASGHA